MKQILLALLIITAGSAIAQTKKEKYYTTDSIYRTSYCDTIKGNIEYHSGSGTIRGAGIIVRCAIWECHVSLPKPPMDITGLDSSYHHADMSFLVSNPAERAYIKTMKGYKLIQEKFVFIPKIQQ